jgi:hypothetical protein
MLRILNITKDVLMLPIERTAWAWVICLLIVPATYFIVTSKFNTSHENMDLEKLKYLAVALLVMATTAIGIRIYNYMLRAKDGSTSVDERDHRFEQIGVNKAYPILMGGMILVGFVMPFKSTQWEMIDAAFFAIVLAELVHYGYVLKAYRSENND